MNWETLGEATLVSTHVETQARGSLSTRSVLTEVAPGALVTVLMAGIRLGSATVCLLVATQEEQFPVKYSYLVEETWYKV